MTPIPVFAGERYQRGHGLGGLFRIVARLAAPALKQVGRKAIRSVGKHALKAGTDVLSDVIKGRSLKQSVKARAKERSKAAFNEAIREAQRHGVLGVTSRGPPGIEPKKTGVKRKRTTTTTKQGKAVAKSKKLKTSYNDIFTR